MSWAGRIKMGLGQGGGLATVPRAVGHICVTGWHEEERKSGWIDSSAGKHKDLSVISKTHAFKKAGYGDMYSSQYWKSGNRKSQGLLVSQPPLLASEKSYLKIIMMMIAIIIIII